jgi:superfamily II DNA helicase RecQ
VGGEARSRLQHLPQCAIIPPKLADASRTAKFSDFLGAGIADFGDRPSGRKLIILSLSELGWLSFQSQHNGPQHNGNMKVKTFYIRLSDEHRDSDQNTISDFLENVRVRKTCAHFIEETPSRWSILVFYDSLNAAQSTTQLNKHRVLSVDELTEDEKTVYRVLKQWRYDKANELNVPGFMICHNTELMTIAKRKPASLEELCEIYGFGAHKIARFGDDILAVLDSI